MGGGSCGGGYFLVGGWLVWVCICGDLISFGFLVVGSILRFLGEVLVVFCGCGIYGRKRVYGREWCCCVCSYCVV